MLGAAHSAANPLTAHFGIVHGAAVGLMIPQVIRFNAADLEVRAIYADLAATAGGIGAGASSEAAASMLADRFQGWLHLAEIPSTLTAAGVDAAKIPLLAEEASRQWTATFNPRPITAPDFERLYGQAL
jgi:alcohol dehydrogenase